MKEMGIENTTSQENAPVVSKIEQEIEETTRDFSEPELKSFLRGLEENSRKPIRDCYFENFKKGKTTYIQEMLALVERAE